MANTHYVDGKWVSSDDLKISAFDLSITRGFGVFDFLRTYGNKPFMLKDHIRRFYNSLMILGLPPAKKEDDIIRIVTRGIQKNNYSETNIKIIQTGGLSEDGITPNNSSSLVVMFTPATKYPDDFYTKGIKVITAPMGRIYTGAKSLNYMAGVIALQKAKAQGAIEALYIGDSKIYECVASNFYAVMKGKIVTAKKNILMGITRKVIFTLAKKLNVPIIERDIFIREIPNFGEAFISASNKEIMPVIKIDNKTIGNGIPGDVTNKLMEEFRKMTKG